jgi:hypothetical protein
MVRKITLGMLAFSLIQAAGAQTTYRGEALVVGARVLGIGVSIEDTGSLPTSGGSLSTELLSVNLPTLLKADLLSANTSGQNGETDSRASVADVSLTVPGVTVTASVLSSSATATCRNAFGSSVVLDLKVNGLSVFVTGAPNQTVPLLVGTLVINEQSSYVVNTSQGSSGDMLVNALHLRVLGVADVVISSSRAGVSCAAATGVPG